MGGILSKESPKDEGAHIDIKAWAVAVPSHQLGPSSFTTEHSRTELIIDEDLLLNFGVTGLNYHIKHNKKDLKRLKINLQKIDSEKTLLFKVCLGFLLKLEELDISHATDEEIMQLHLFERNVLSMKRVNIQGPKLDTGTALKFSEQSLTVICCMCEIQDLALRNMLIRHNDMKKLFDFLSNSKSLQNLDLSDVRCIDHNEQCQGICLDLSIDSCLTYLDIHVHSIFQVPKLIAKDPIQPVSILPGSLTRLSLFFANGLYSSARHVCVFDLLRQLQFLVRKTLHLKQFDLQNMTVGFEKIPTITFFEERIHTVFENEYDEPERIKLYTKLIGDHVDFENTHFKLRDFQLERDTHNSFADSVILNFVSYELVKKYPEEVEEAYASSQGPDKRPVLVCILKTDIPISEFGGFQLQKQLLAKMSISSLIGETAVDRDSDKYKEVVMNSFEDLNATLEYHASQLILKHSNIEAVRVSFVKIRKSSDVAIQPCVVIYCKVKSAVPYKEECFPSVLKHPDKNITFQTDVREGYFRFCTFENRGDIWSKELAMGCSIGEIDTNVGATIGPFVNVVETGETCFLAPRHMFPPISRPDNSIVGVTVVQPSDIFIPQNMEKENKECGQVIACQLGDQIDAALVKICKERIPSRGNFIHVPRPNLTSAGLRPEELPTFDDGSILNVNGLSAQNLVTSRIIKIGIKTNLTTGNLLTTNGIVRETVSYTTLEIQFNGRREKMHITSQLLVYSDPGNVFCQVGDSGSAVFLLDSDNKMYCIGMVIGILNDLTCVVTPIQKILDILGNQCGKQLELKKFSFTEMDTS